MQNAISYSLSHREPSSVWLAKITEHKDEREGKVTCKSHDLFENGPKCLGELKWGPGRGRKAVCACASESVLFAYV